jgi:hypothetical protein
MLREVEKWEGGEGRKRKEKEREGMACCSE